ncbi:unnamed protein product [Caenorhabditis bovis]|uniref:C2 domain-containing protein n=1 Tax=Caenorhabditis bovis TaxID=2654633 RepID=A0A8S1FCU6_9PELO|nr:unnamed protein product [Caenorhabditis bovis]
MKDEAIESIFAALTISFSDDLEHRNVILRRFAEQTYSLQIRPHSGTIINNQSIQVYIIEPEYCRGQSLNPNGVTKIEIGPTTNVSLRFGLSKEETRKGIGRSASLLKKVMRSDSKKNMEILQIGQLPLGSAIKKSVNLMNNKAFTGEFKLMRIDHRNLVRMLDFDEFLETARVVHEWQSEQIDGSVYDGKLDNTSFSMFYSIAFFFEIPSFVLKVCEMTCFLVWDDTETNLDERALTEVCIQMTACENDVDTGNPLMQPSLVYLNECTREAIIEFMDSIRDEPIFPPVSYHRLKPINDRLKLIADICVLSIWDRFAAISSPTECLFERFLEFLVNRSKQWVERVEKMAFGDVCSCLQNLCNQMCSESPSYQIFFQQFGIGYISTTFRAIDEQISRILENVLGEQLAKLDSRNPEKLEHFTKTTMRMFMNVRNLTELAKNFKISDLKLYEFEVWFKETIVFWAYSWREVTQKMVERTISLDEDGDSVKYGARRPLPAGLYSFLCIQKGISDDLCRLEFTLPQNLVTSSISVVNILCQNINAYAKKLFGEAMRSHEEMASRMVRATNGIEQAMSFVEEGYERFAQIGRVQQFVDEKDFAAVQTTASRLLKLTRETCEQQISVLLSHYSQLKKEIVVKIAKNLTSDSRDSSSTLKPYMREISSNEKIDSILDCCYGLIDDVRCLLLPNCFKIATRHFAAILEREIRKNVKQNQIVEYYSNLYITLKLIYEMLEIEDEKDIELLSNLHLNSFSTFDLILSYYDTLCDKIARTKFFDAPTVDVNISYSKIENNETILIQIKLVKMSPLEWIDVLSERVDLFVRLELLPKMLFPSNKFEAPTTNPVPQSTRPQWKQLFEIRVPLEQYFTRGACLAISVFDHERKIDRLIGRGYIGLHSVPPSCDENRNDAIRVPLLPNDYSDHKNMFYQLIKNRASHDANAREFIETRQKRHLRIGDIPRYIRRNRSRVATIQ